MTNRNVACAAAALGLALGGCASTSAGTSSLHEFKFSFEGAQRQLHSIGVDAGLAVSHAGIKNDAQRASQLNALAARAEQEAVALDRLDPPAQYNTRLRVLGSTLIAMADDLTSISSAATGHNSAVTKSARHAVLVDAADVKSADAAESAALGLPSAEGP